MDLYYGFGAASDPVRARQCALAAVGHGADDPGLYGNGVLINVYANGRGAPRDLDRAIRYACDDGIASAFDRTTRVNRLMTLKGRAAPAKPFDYCDNATSDYAVGQCMDVEAGRAAEARKRRFADLTAGWPADRRAALAAMRRAEAAFATARAQDETNTSGTDRFWLGRGAAEAVHDDTLKLFEQAAAGRLDGAAPGGLAAADQRLNAAYKTLMASDALNAGSDNGDLTRTGVRAAQRAWLTYRDAWLTLSRLAWPKSADALAAALTQARTHQLTCDPDPTRAGCGAR